MTLYIQSQLHLSVYVYETASEVYSKEPGKIKNNSENFSRLIFHLSEKRGGCDIKLFTSDTAVEVSGYMLIVKIGRCGHIFSSSIRGEVNMLNPGVGAQAVRSEYFLLYS